MSLFDFTDLLDLFFSWRFYLCAGIGCGIAALIYYNIPNQTIALIIAVPVALVGIIFGLIWDHRVSR